MGRLGLWTHGDRQIRTPNVAFVDAAGFPAPEWAEILAARDGRGPRNVSFGVGGSFFLPRPGVGEIPLPDRSGLPPGVEIEIPREATRGAVALVSSLAQVPADAEV